MNSKLKQNATIGVTTIEENSFAANNQFWNIAIPEIATAFPEYVDRIAGVHIPGSKSYQIFMTTSDFTAAGSDFQQLMDDLGQPAEVYSMDRFFASRTSVADFEGIPIDESSPAGWMRIPEAALYDITHAQVIYDPLTEFSKRRKTLLAYYPDDIRIIKLRKVIRECSHYIDSYTSATEAKDEFSAEIAWARFAHAAMHLGFILNRVYIPCDQRLYDAFSKLTDIGCQVSSILWTGQWKRKIRTEVIERIFTLYCNLSVDLDLAAELQDNAVGLLSEIASRISSTQGDAGSHQIAHRRAMVTG